MRTVGISTKLWLSVVEELVMHNSVVCWRYVPDHPWGDIMVWLQTDGTGWSSHPDYQDRQERLVALKRAYAEYYNTKYLVSKSDSPQQSGIRKTSSGSSKVVLRGSRRLPPRVRNNNRKGG